MYTYNATLIRVVDGDTIYAEVDLGFKASIKIELRLARIDAPERRTFEGKLAKQFLTDLLIENPKFTIKTEKDKNYIDKDDLYGRYIAEVVLFNGLNVNEWLVANDHAVFKNY